MLYFLFFYFYFFSSSTHSLPQAVHECTSIFSAGRGLGTRQSLVRRSSFARRFMFGRLSVYRALFIENLVARYPDMLAPSLVISSACSLKRLLSISSCCISLCRDCSSHFRLALCSNFFAFSESPFLKASNA